MKTARVVATGLVLAMLATACGAADDSPTTDPGSPTVPPSLQPFVAGELISLDIAREAPDVAETDVMAVAEGDALFGLALFDAVAGDDNVMISPYSVATALSMLYPGARGDTASEIGAVLNLSVDDATLHAVRNYIDSVLIEDAPRPPDDDREPFTIRPANSAWGQGGFPFSEDYLTVLAANYGAGLRVVDYVAAPEESAEIINGWVEDVTEDRIKDLLPPGTVTMDTRLVLVNAIWFKANWSTPFDPERTSPGQFHLLDGSTITVPLMHGTQRAQLAETDKYTALRIPYAGDAAMVVMLPAEGTTPAELAKSLEPGDLSVPWQGYEVDITLPSFEFDSDVPLKAPLQSLGIVAAFDPDVADLSGITDATDLYVQDALHKSFIALDEEGTEAAAATAIIVGLTSAGPPPAAFVADRPFLFWIEHSTTGEMLFLGQLTNPS